MKLLKSFEDFLYELVGWLVFYPITLYRSVVHPIAMLHYSHLEIAEPEEDQYTDTLSPPIFLLITLFVLLLVGKALKPHELDDVRRILGSDTSLLLFRGVVFSIFPVLMAVDLVRRQGKRIDRRSLRSPFYGQCFITAPFALIASIGGMLIELHGLPYVFLGIALFFIAVIWYVAVEIRWFSATLNISKRRAAWDVLTVVVLTNILVVAIALGVNYLSKHSS